MKYKGKLINAYYFSTSWGYTTDYRIWGIKKQKYLKETNLTTITENISNEKIFDKYIKEKPKSVEKKSPFYRWTTYLTTKQIENSIYKNMAVNVGTINRIEINKSLHFIIRETIGRDIFFRHKDLTAFSPIQINSKIDDFNYRQSIKSSYFNHG